MKNIKGIKAIKHQSVTDEVISQLKNLIQEGSFIEGERLPNELEMCEAFSVGRTTIREALKVLEAKGFLVRSRKGTFVQKLIKEDNTTVLRNYSKIIKRARIIELFEARRALEAEMAGLAAVNAKEEDIEILQDTITNMELYKNDHHLFIEYDAKFHTYLGEACGNQVISYLFGELYDLLLEAIEETTSKDDRIRDWAIKSHENILQNIKQSNSDGARRTMINHVDVVYNLISGTSEE